MEPVQSKGSSWWCCCCPSSTKIEKADERSALMSHVDAAAAGEGGKIYKDPEIDDATVTTQASYSPPPTPTSRPQTPDSAYGDGIIREGTEGEASPGKSIYGPGTKAEDAGGLNDVKV